MNSALFFVLIALATGPVLGQETLKNQLQSLMALMTEHKTICANIIEQELVIEILPEILPTIQQLKTAIDNVKLQADRLPVAAGNFLNNTDNQQLLQKTVTLNAQANIHCLMALGGKLRIDRNNIAFVNDMLFHMSQMTNITSTLQTRINDWSTIPIDNSSALDDTRYTLLVQFDMIVSRMCGYKQITSEPLNSLINDQTRMNAQKVLDSIRMIVQQVTVQSCNGSVLCNTELVPGAEALDEGSKCLQQS